MISEFSDYQSNLNNNVGANSDRDRVERLKDLVHKLLAELSSLNGPRTFEAAEFRKESRIDFRNEVRRYETELIEWALGVTDGHQLKAAQLLGVKPTTLNEKMRVLGVVPRKTRRRGKRWRRSLARRQAGQE